MGNKFCSFGRLLAVMQRSSHRVVRYVASSKRLGSALSRKWGRSGLISDTVSKGRQHQTSYHSCLDSHNVVHCSHHTWQTKNHAKNLCMQGQTMSQPTHLINCHARPVPLMCRFTDVEIKTFWGDVTCVCSRHHVIQLHHDVSSQVILNLYALLWCEQHAAAIHRTLECDTLLGDICDIKNWHKQQQGCPA